MDFMTKLRNILIAGAALALPLVAVASPAGASTPHPKFITAIHRVAPASKHLTNKYLINLGETACHTLGQHPTTPGVVDGDFGPVAEVLGTIQDDNLQYNDGLSDTQISEVLGVSILYLCPSYEPGVKQFDQIEGSGVTDPGGGSEWVWQPASSAPPTPTTTNVGARSGDSVPVSSCTSSGIAQRSGHAGDQVVPSTGVLSQVSLTGTNGGLEVNWTFSTGVPIPTSELAYILDVQIFQKKSAAGHSIDTSFGVTIGAGGVPGNHWTGTVAKYKTWSSFKSHSVVVGEVDNEVLVFVPHSSLSGLKQPFYWDASESVSSITTGATDQAFCPNAQIKSNHLVVPVPYSKFPNGTSRVTETTTTTSTGVGQSAALPSRVTTTSITGNDQPPPSSEPTNAATSSPTSAPSNPSTTTTTAPCISGTASSTISATSTPYDDTSVGATEYMIDVSGVVTNNSNAPLVVSSVSYTVEYTSGGSESGTVSINETLPPGRSDSWDTGSFNYPVAESSVAVTDVSYSSASSEVGCSGG